MGHEPSTGDHAAPSGVDANHKDAWRRWARFVRDAWASNPTQRHQDEAALQAALLASNLWKSASCVLTYLPFASEVAPIPLDTHAGGVHLHLPGHAPTLATTRTDDGVQALTLHLLQPPLALQRLGFWQPLATAPTVDARDIDLVLVPGLAFDQHGTRIGYGRGLYDRLLLQLDAHVPRVGVGIDDLCVRALPRNAHDVAMTHLLTPSGLRAVAKVA